MTEQELRIQAYEANMMLVEHSLVILTWGNVSVIDHEKGRIAIKPSGVEYDTLKPADIVILDTEGNAEPGSLRPSSDTPTHLILYKRFPRINAVVHTHSPWATSWAQAGMGIPCFGTTHADHFYGTVPCTRPLTKEEIDGDYEAETGNVIAQTFSGDSYAQVPAVLVHGHGPFTWGRNGKDAVHNALVLEETAKMAFQTLMLNPNAMPISQTLLDKHFLRKHGANAYYGQEKREK